MRVPFFVFYNKKFTHAYAFAQRTNLNREMLFLRPIEKNHP